MRLNSNTSMRKREALSRSGLVAVLTLVLVGTWSGAMAEGLMDPLHIPAKNQFSIGIEAGYQDKIEFEDTTANATRHISDGTIEHYTYAVTNLRVKEDQFYYGTLNYGILDRLALFAKAGILADGIKSSGASPDKYYNFDNTFSWGFGGKCRLFESEKGGFLVLAAQYLRYDNRGQARAWNSTWTTDYELDQWRLEAELVGGWNIGNVTPYVGIKFTRAEAELTGTSTGVVSGLTRSTYSEYSSNNDHPVGGLIGVAWDITPAWRMAVQGDFLVDTSVGISLACNFQRK